MRRLAHVAVYFAPVGYPIISCRRRWQNTANSHAKSHKITDSVQSTFGLRFHQQVIGINASEMAAGPGPPAAPSTPSFPLPAEVPEEGAEAAEAHEERKAAATLFRQVVLSGSLNDFVAPWG